MEVEELRLEALSECENSKGSKVSSMAKKNVSCVFMFFPFLCLKHCQNHTTEKILNINKLREILFLSLCG